MNCPFLQEARVRYCHAAPVRKMLMQTAPAADELCSSASYPDCRLYQEREAPSGHSATCPFLHESHVQYCGAGAVPHLVPFSEATLMRCGQSAFRYCELYLQFARPAGRCSQADDVDGIEFPAGLRYTPNHLWIDVADDGSWRIGVDGLLAHALGRVDAVSYLTQPGRTRPSAVLTAGGVDLQISFPHVVPLTMCNTWVRADPGRVTSAPYTGGWLFGGDQPPEKLDGMVTGSQASAWMRGEVQRASEFAHAQLEPGMPADGGLLVRGFAGLLPREQRLRFLNEFFSPMAGWTDHHQ